jgi:hypothetical protein
VWNVSARPREDCVWHVCRTRCIPRFGSLDPAPLTARKITLCFGSCCCRTHRLHVSFRAAVFLSWVIRRPHCALCVSVVLVDPRYCRCADVFVFFSPSVRATLVAPVSIRFGMAFCLTINLAYAVMWNAAVELPLDLGCHRLFAVRGCQGNPKTSSPGTTWKMTWDSSRPRLLRVARVVARRAHQVVDLDVSGRSREV